MSSVSSEIMTHRSAHPKIFTDPEFACPICKELFRRKRNLAKHLEIHSGILNEVSCELCLKKVGSLKTLRRHIQLIHNPKKFICETCKKEFTAKTSLERHVRIHTSERPFKCCFCDYDSSAKGNLMKHVRNFHNKLEFTYKDVLKESGLYHDPKAFINQSKLKRIERRGQAVLSEFEANLRKKGIPFTLDNIPKKKELTAKQLNAKKQKRGNKKSAKNENDHATEPLSLDLNQSILHVYSGETIHYTIVPDKGSMKLITESTAITATHEPLPILNKNSSKIDNTSNSDRPTKDDDFIVSIYEEPILDNYPVISIDDLSNDQCKIFNYNEPSNLIDQSLLCNFDADLNSGDCREASVQICPVEESDEFNADEEIGEFNLVPEDELHDSTSECIVLETISDSTSQTLAVDAGVSSFNDVTEDCVEDVMIPCCSEPNNVKIKKNRLSDDDEHSCRIFKVKTKRGNDPARRKVKTMKEEPKKVEAVALNNVEKLPKNCKNLKGLNNDDFLYVSSIEESELKKDPDVIISIGTQY